jgi:hypothetical protein
MHLPTHSPRRLAAAAAIACVAALTPVAALAATSSAAPAAGRTPSCATSDLVVWLNVPPGNHYAGGAGYYLEFTNLSGHACTLSGHPGVSAVSLTGRQIGSPAGWDSTPRHLVRLANGATATATLQVGDPGNWYQCFLPGSLGRPGKPGLLPTAAGLRVYPPNQFASKVIPYPLTGCAHAGPVNMHAGPVTPGVPAE